MSNYFELTLDTTAPASPTLSLEGGAAYATAQLINATIGCGDGATTGYQMKLWGDVDPANNANIQATEGASAWITYSASQQIKLSSGDGSKSIYLKVRDEVSNESAQASDTIILDTTLPVVTVGIPDVPKVSKVAGRDVCSNTFQADVIFNEYKIKFVSAPGAAHDTGVQIGTANGSINMSGTAGNYPANTNINYSINGADLEAASSGDGAKIIKVFVRDQSGQWSV